MTFDPNTLRDLLLDFWNTGGRALGLLLLLALLVAWITHRLLPRIVRRLVLATQTRFDDALLARGVLRQFAHAAPLLVLYAGIAAVPRLHDEAITLIQRLLAAMVVFFIARAISKFLSALNDIYESSPAAHRRPIKGYVQLGKLLTYIVVTVLALAILLGKSPLLLLSGLGALGAIVVLVFKDTILSFVASVQLASNDMLRIGDWIEMPSLGVDGDVIDIALHTVKVQNFDKTIVTVPTYRLIQDSFRNWRGMSDSGGRRIKRALLLDQASVHFIDDEEQARLARFALLDAHFERKRDELVAWNDTLGAQGAEPVNTRRLSNLGCFRAYVTAYLRAHPRIDERKTLMARQLEPTASGLPLEVYCFTDTTLWVEYEGIQADVFDHLLAILPEFGLRVAQQPGGADIARAVATLSSPSRQGAMVDGGAGA